MYLLCPARNLYGNKVDASSLEIQTHSNHSPILAEIKQYLRIDNLALILVKKVPECYIIRKYQEDDREQCRYLWRELVERHREIYQKPTIGGEHPEDYFDKHLAKVGSDKLWVAVHNSLPVGLVGLIVEGNEAEIEPLIVSKAYRGKGVGKQLVEAIISESRRMGIRTLSVKPVARNIQSIKFLYKQGFKNLGEIELFMSFSDYSWKAGPELFGCKFNF